MYRIISNPNDATPTLVATSASDLPAITNDGYDEQGTSVLVLTPAATLYMADGEGGWVNV